MDIHLAPEVSFDILLEDLQAKFRSGARFFKGAQMAVSFSGRPLNRTEEEQILDIITDTTGVDIVCIIEHDDKNEIMYKSAVEQTLLNMQKETVSSTEARSKKDRSWSRIPASSSLAMWNREPGSPPKETSSS